MAANFRSDDWTYIKDKLEKTLKNQRSVLESVDKSYKDKLVATGQVLLIKTLLDMPQTATLPHKD